MNIKLPDAAANIFNCLNEHLIHCQQQLQRASDGEQQAVSAINQFLVSSAEGMGLNPAGVRFDVPSKSFVQVQVVEEKP